MSLESILKQSSNIFSHTIETFDRPMRILVIPDSHHPFVDMYCWEVLLDVAAKLGFDIVVILGDFIDYYSLSFFTKDPIRRQAITLEYEHGEATKALRQLENALGENCKLKFYCDGNHEVRLFRTIAEKAPELWELIKHHDLLERQKHGWTIVPYKQSVRLGKIAFSHDYGSAGIHAGLQAAKEMMASCIMGHNHVVSWCVVGDINNVPYLGCSMGWLGDIYKVDYMHRDKAKSKWTHCIGTGWITEDGFGQINPHVFLPGHQLIIEGQRFKYNHKSYFYHDNEGVKHEH